MKSADFKTFVKTEKAKPGAVEAIQSSGGVNSWLMAMYQDMTGQKVFRTMKAWRELGYIVQKGASSFPIFSRPSTVLKAEKGKPVEDDEQAYFFICHLFHAGQVIECKDKNGFNPNSEAAADLICGYVTRSDVSE